MEKLKCGGINKFIVIKREDLKYINSPFKVAMLGNDLKDIENGRRAEGKKIDNEYIVINTDESYAQDVIEILKRHGHWG
jgi:hypothetical protein